jgi:transposase InsO family protein
MLMVFITKPEGIPRWDTYRQPSLRKTFVHNKKFLFLVSNKWLQDHFIPTANGRIYCTIILDLFSRMVVELAIEASMTVKLVGIKPPSVSCLDG